MKITARHKKYLTMAAKVAGQNRTCVQHRHGAVLVKGGSVISYSTNKNALKWWVARFRHRDRGHATKHAEVGCIHNIDRSKTTGSTLYVARIGNTGNLLMSEPCPMCKRALANAGIKKVYYTLNEEEMGILKL